MRVRGEVWRLKDGGFPPRERALGRPAAGALEVSCVCQFLQRGPDGVTAFLGRELFELLDIDLPIIRLRHEVRMKPLRPKA